MAGLISALGMAVAGKRVLTSEPSSEYAVRALVSCVMRPEELLGSSL